MESYSKSKIKASGRFNKLSAHCKKHPTYRQSPGVCSICLSQKLSQLTDYYNCSSRAKSGRPQSSSSSSYLSSLSSSNASSYTSPVVISCTKSNTRILKNISGEEMFKKSRSMDYVWQRRKEDHENEKNVEKKRGFWSKLLLPRRKYNYKNNNKGLMYSRTTRERAITQVVG